MSIVGKFQMGAALDGGEGKLTRLYTLKPSEADCNPSHRSSGGMSLSQKAASSCSV